MDINKKSPGVMGRWSQVATTFSFSFLLSLDKESLWLSSNLTDRISDYKDSAPTELKKNLSSLQLQIFRSYGAIIIIHVSFSNFLLIFAFSLIGIPLCL